MPRSAVPSRASSSSSCWCSPLLFSWNSSAASLPHLLLEAQQNAGELLLLEGLEQIVLHAVFQRVLGIFKFPVSADDDEMQFGLEGLGPLDQFDAVAAGHPDVRDQQMRLLFPHQLQCPQSIVGGACDLVAKRLPVDQLLHQQDHLCFRHRPKRPAASAAPPTQILIRERENEPVFPFPVIIRYFSVFAKNFWRISGSICRF